MTDTAHYTVIVRDMESGKAGTVYRDCDALEVEKLAESFRLLLAKRYKRAMSIGKWDEYGNLPIKSSTGGFYGIVKVKVERYV